MKFKVKTQHYDLLPGRVLYHTGVISAPETNLTGTQHLVMTADPVKQEPLYVVPLTKLEPVKE
jgi:hypothetical protein